jgi:hypothetical protein
MRAIFTEKALRAIPKNARIEIEAIASIIK